MKLFEYSSNIIYDPIKKNRADQCPSEQKSNLTKVHTSGLNNARLSFPRNLFSILKARSSIA